MACAVEQASVDLHRETYGTRTLHAADTVSRTPPSAAGAPSDAEAPSAGVPPSVAVTEGGATEGGATVLEHAMTANAGESDPERTQQRGDNILIRILPWRTHGGNCAPDRKPPVGEGHARVDSTSDLRLRRQGRV